MDPQLQGTPLDAQKELTDSATEKSREKYPGADRPATAYARDMEYTEAPLGLNRVESGVNKQREQRSQQEDARRVAQLQKADLGKAGERARPAQHAGGNEIESDEIFTATQSMPRSTVPPEIEKQYLRVGNKFYQSDENDVPVFEDKGNKLETQSDGEQTAELMVRIAEARGWDEIKVSGSETFRKEVWLEAAARGMHVKGYTPTEQDKAELTKRTRESDANKTPNTLLAEVFQRAPAENGAMRHPELAGAYATELAIEKQAEADGLSPQQRTVMMARVRQNVFKSIERGHFPHMKVKEVGEGKHEMKEEREHSR